MAVTLVCVKVKEVADVVLEVVFVELDVELVDEVALVVVCVAVVLETEMLVEIEVLVEEILVDVAVSVVAVRVVSTTACGAGGVMLDTDTVKDTPSLAAAVLISDARLAPDKPCSAPRICVKEALSRRMRRSGSSGITAYSAATMCGLAPFKHDSSTLTAEVSTEAVLAMAAAIQVTAVGLEMKD